MHEQTPAEFASLQLIGVRQQHEALLNTNSRYTMTTIQTIIQALPASQDMLNAVAAPLLVLDADGCLLFYNAAFCEISRHSPEVLKGRALSQQFLEGEDVQRLARLFQDLNPQQPSQKFEGDWCDAEGVRHRWRRVFQAVFDEAGQVRYVLGTEIDTGWGARAGSWYREDEISAQHEAATCEVRFTTGVDQLPFPTTIFNKEGWVLVYNQASADWWGIANKSGHEYNLRTDQQCIDLGINHLIEKAFSGEVVELPLVKYDPQLYGTEHAGARWVRSLMFPIKERGKLLEVVLMTFDITEQKIVEDALRKAHAELEDRVRHRTAELQSEIVERQRAEQAMLEEKDREVVPLRSLGDAVIATDPVGRVRTGCDWAAARGVVPHLRRRHARARGRPGAALHRTWTHHRSCGTQRVVGAQRRGARHRRQ